MRDRPSGAPPAAPAPTSWTPGCAQCLTASPVSCTWRASNCTRGYLGRAAETAARFVAEPNRSGARMYRTGDLVRRMPDGGLEFLGRSDDQLKIRGFRVEPGEIAAVLNSHDQVRGSHVTARSHANGSRLTAYVAAGGTPPPVTELRSMLAKRLPRYLVPHHIVVLDELPLTPHGKIDEKALAAIDFDEGPGTPPGTPTETELAGAFADVFGNTDVDVTAGFLQMGLDSIVALSVVQAARRRGIALRARLMLECDTIRELAAAVDADAAAGTPPNWCGRDRRADPRAAQRSLAVRARRSTPACPDRSHQAARHDHARRAGCDARRHPRRARGVAVSSGSGRDDACRATENRHLERSVGRRRNGQRRRKGYRRSAGESRPAGGPTGVGGVAARTGRPRAAGTDGARAGHGPGLVAHRAR